MNMKKIKNYSLFIVLVTAAATTMATEQRKTVSVGAGAGASSFVLDAATKARVDASLAQDPYADMPLLENELSEVTVQERLALVKQEIEKADQRIIVQAKTAEQLKFAQGKTEADILQDAKLRVAKNPALDKKLKAWQVQNSIKSNGACDVLGLMGIVKELYPELDADSRKNFTGELLKALTVNTQQQAFAGNADTFAYLESQGIKTGADLQKLVSASPVMTQHIAVGNVSGIEEEFKKMFPDFPKAHFDRFVVTFIRAAMEKSNLVY